MKINRKDILLYIGCSIFVVISIYGLMNKNSEKDFIMNLSALLLFGGCGIIYFFLKNNFNSKRIIDNRTQIIYESKKQSFFYFLGSLVFVIVGGIMIIYKNLFYGWKMNPNIALITGIICVAFFGIIFLASLIRLINPKRKLIEITSSGLKIQTGILKDKMIFINKDEINLIKENEISENSFISIYVKNPEKFVNKNILKNMNYKMTGTPIYINPSISNFSCEEIMKFLEEKFSN